MSATVRLYIGLTMAVALLAWLLAILIEPPSLGWPWLAGLALLLACAVLESRSAQMPGGRRVSIATIPQLAAVFLLPPPIAIAIGGLGMFVEGVRLGEPKARTVFNSAMTTVTVAVTVLTAQLLDVRGARLLEGGLEGVARFFLVALTYYLINSAALAGVVALHGDRSFTQVWWSSAQGSALAEIAMAVIGGLTVFVWLINPAWLTVVLFPMLVAQLTLDYLASTNLKTGELEHQAFHDGLTGLPNRAALQRDLERALRAGNPAVALLMMDLDGFRDINDTFGHQHGDALLRDIASRLAECVGPRGVVARVGGDGFAVLLYSVDVAAAERIGLELLEISRRSFSIDGIELFIAASIGIAVSPEHGLDAAALLRRADVAMYAAKQARHGLTIYRPELDRHDRDRLSLLHDLHVALGAGTLTLAYQPKVYSRTRGLHSVEALLRWTHPVRGPISPAVFVPLAEQAGLSSVISRWVLDQALRQCQTWLSAGRRIPICINISMFDLRDDGFPDLVADRLAAHRVPASLLGVEVTESAAMADPARTRVVLERLQTLGVHVAVDDFGTGYSSLAYLVGLPVNELKIDRSFVARMGSSAQHAAIVRSTISLGHDLNLTVVAEGVEDECALDDLRGFGCDLIQGFTVCRPVPADRFLEWLDEDCALAA